MFGSCDLNRALCALFFLLVCSWVPGAKAQSQRATIVTEGALVYQEADFDAPVIDTLKRGSIYDISKNVKGAFHKIKLKPGTFGWIADTDIRPGEFKISSEKKGDKKKSPGTSENVKKIEKRKPFTATRYRGPVIEFVNYAENTLGKERTDRINFIGIKFAGENTLMDGEIYTDANLLFFSGAPSYYSDFTKKKADGFVVLANFLFETALPQSRWHFLYYGFGPLIKFSHFNLDVPSGTKTLSYAAEDLSVGAIFNLGLAFRLSGSLSIRSDVKYYWEQSQYTSLGLNLGWEF